MSDTPIEIKQMSGLLRNGVLEAVWEELTQVEIDAVKNGLSPIHVAHERLLYYIPVVGDKEITDE